MTEKIILAGSYTPPTFFEEPITEGLEKFTIHIENGSIEVQVKPQFFEDIPAVKQDVEKYLSSRFNARTFHSRATPSFTVSNMQRISSSGRTDHTIFLQAGELCLKGNPIALDIVKKDKNGTIIVDTKKERLMDEHNLALLLNKHADNPLLIRLLSSHQNALRHPEDEFVYLYEIREALADYFSGKSQACKSLGVSETEWHDFGKITNAVPLPQSRHRGKFPTLRSATQAEIDQCRQFAIKLIRGYLNYLESMNHTSP